MSHESDPQNIDYRSTLSLTRVHNALARENPDRVAESRPVSLWISLGAIAVATIGAASFGANRGFGSDGRVPYNKFGASYRPEPPPPVVPPPPDGPQDPFKLGEKVYKNKCINCHLSNGLGQPGQYPPLDGSEWVLGGTERTATIVGFGLAGPITVKGQTFSAAIMAPHGPPVLTPVEFAGVLTFIRNNWSNKAEPVAVDGVIDFFKRHAGRTAQASEAELLKIPEDKMLGGAATPAAESTPPTPPTGAPQAPGATPPATIPPKPPA